MVYVPPLDEEIPSGKKSLAELIKGNKDIQERLKDIQLDKEYVKMEDMYDRPITILGFEDVKEPSKYKEGEIQEFTRIYFYFSDDEKKIRHSCRTQAKKLIEPLHAIGNDYFKELGGVPTMISAKQEGKTKLCWFDGLD